MQDKNAARLLQQNSEEAPVCRPVSFRAELGNNAASNAVREAYSSLPAKAKTPRMHQDVNKQHVDDKEFEKSLDAKLVARVQKGDKRAFDLLVIKYQARVASVVSRFVGEFHEISDVTQETFIKAYRAISSFRGDSAFYTWLYRIAINCAKNFLVAKGRRPPSSDLDYEDSPTAANSQTMRDIASPESELSRDQLEQVVNQAIAALPEDLKVAFTLREFEGLSYEEIADVMGCPVGTVRSRIFRARESVDKEIQPLLS